MKREKTDKMMFAIPRHDARAALLGALLLALPAAASAQTAVPLRIVVPFGPGSFPDTVARIVGQKMADNLGRPLVVDNRAGAGGNLGTEAVVTARADGNTLLLHTVANAINQSLYRKLPFDAQRDLAPIVQLASVGNVLVVPPSLGVGRAAEFLDLARARKQGLAFASGGPGTTSHLAGQLLKTMAKVELNHIPYKNFNQALTDVIAGQPDFIMPNLPPTLPHIQSGRLRALAVTSARRSSLLPDVPTLAEAGVPGYEVSSWNGLAAPAGTPPEVIARLNAEALRALKDPEVRKKLSVLGAEPGGASSAEYTAWIASETAKWARVVADSGAQVD